MKRKEGTRLHRRNALGRTGQDGPRENEDEISEGGSRMDGRTRGKRVRICLPFSAGETARWLVSIRHRRSDINVPEVNSEIQRERKSLAAKAI